MKRIGGVFDQVASFENLLLAIRKAARGKRHKPAVIRFYLDYENELIRIQEELRAGSYQPRPFHQFEVREPKVRTICSSDFRDRVVHHAICNLLEPLFESRSICDSYACRVGKGSHSAVRKCQLFSKRFGYFLKCDIRRYFESIDHTTLKTILRRIVKDTRLLSLIDRIIDHPVPGNATGKGLPIGNLTSQHFANLYLGELDHYLKERLRVKGYIRYMDDFILFANSKAELRVLHGQIEEFVQTQLRLSLKSEVTVIAPLSVGVPFLGFRIFRGLIRLQRPNLIRMRRKIRAQEELYRRGLLPEHDLVNSMNSVLAHISHANTKMLLRKEVLRSLKMA